MRWLGGAGVLEEGGTGNQESSEELVEEERSWGHGRKGTSRRVKANEDKALLPQRSGGFHGP